MSRTHGTAGTVCINLGLYTADGMMATPPPVLVLEMNGPAYYRESFMVFRKKRRRNSRALIQAGSGRVGDNPVHHR